MTPREAVVACRKRMGEAFAAYQSRGERGDEKLQADVDAALGELYDAGVAEGVGQGLKVAIDKMRETIYSLEENE